MVWDVVRSDEVRSDFSFEAERRDARGQMALTCDCIAVALMFCCGLGIMPAG